MTFWEPTPEHLAKLSQPWCCSYSGGKDSTSLVTWLEWLRRSGQLSVPNPKLVQSDTTVEYPVLTALSGEMMTMLTARGWECAIVSPELHQKLYNRILGIGNAPIHPGIRHMRWCTRSTKIDPMDKWRKANAGGLNLTGVRWGESKMRDGKLERVFKGCAAGGECGLPEPDAENYSPVIHWTTCNVIDWLKGWACPDSSMDEFWKVTRKLLDIYAVHIEPQGFDFHEPDVSAARFGCIGCPAIGAYREAPRSAVTHNGQGSPLNELYDVWFEARRRRNRCFRPVERKRKNARFDGYGPIKMAVRKELFARIMDIQCRAGVVLLTQADEKFIHQCWADKVYPRGWSESDELVEPPSDMALFDLPT